MTPTEEARLLSDLLKRIESGQGGSRHARLFAIANWVLLVVAFIALFQIAPRVGSIVYVVAGVAGILGVLTSFVVINGRAIEQWPVLAPFIRADEVRRRLEELKPNKSLERTREG
jgi:hypothetical protein